MQFSDFYGSVQNLCTICKLSRHEAIHATPLGKSPTQQRPPGRRGQSEGGNGVLPVARSAVPAGTQARLLLTYIRLVEGGRLRRRRWEFRPEHRVGVGRKAFVMTAGYPARQDLLARIERVRLLELEEGVRRPVEDYGPDARASRRRSRAEMLHGTGTGDQRRDDGDGSTQLGGREREHGMGARDGEAATEGCALGVGMQQHQRGDEVETVAPSRRRGDGSEQNLASLGGSDADAEPGGDTSSASGGNDGGNMGSDTDTHTHTHSHTHGVLGWLLDRVAEGWARVRSAFGDG